MNIPTELEYKQKIENAFNEGNYSEVIVLENDMIEQAYTTIANEVHISADSKHKIPEERIFKFFQEHNFATVLMQKGLAALHVGDPSLSGQSLHDAVKSIPDDSDFVAPFFYFAFIQAVSGYATAAKETIKAAIKKDPELLKLFDEYYQNIEFAAPPDYKENFRTLCEVI